MVIDIEAQVKAFVAAEWRTDPRRLNPSTTLAGDLGIAGDDGRELIDAFGKKFGVDLAGFDSLKHFGPEAGANPLTLLHWFIEEILLKRETHEVWDLTPITIGDLVQAAESKRWIL